MILHLNDAIHAISIVKIVLDQKKYNVLKYFIFFEQYLHFNLLLMN